MKTFGGDQISEGSGSKARSTFSNVQSQDECDVGGRPQKEEVRA